jgi:hypothetical protein
MKLETRKAIKEYHEYHGDTKIKIVKEISDHKGLRAALVRIGDDTSCIDMISNYISEFDSCSRDSENDMVKRFENGEEAL